MPIFDTFQRASFNGTPFPVDSIDVRGGIREHVHEYPHSDGGTPEKMGRKLYEIHFSALFHDRFAAYPGLYPGTLSTLQGVWESQLTANLVVPTIGSIKAYAVSWDRKAVGRVRSGERVELVFREDMPVAGIEAFLMNATNSNAMNSAGAALRAAMPAGQSHPSLFDDLLNAVNSLLGVVDQANLYGNLIQAKLLGILSMCQDLDAMTFLQDPSNWQLAAAMRDVWKTTADGLKDLAAKKHTLSTFFTRVTMSVSDIAIALYNDATRAVELLQLNPIADAFAVPAGTAISYYPDT